MELEKLLFCHSNGNFLHHFVNQFWQLTLPVQRKIFNYSSWDSFCFVHKRINIIFRCLHIYRQYISNMFCVRFFFFLFYSNQLGFCFKFIFCYVCVLFYYCCTTGSFTPHDEHCCKFAAHSFSFFQIYFLFSKKKQIFPIYTCSDRRKKNQYCLLNCQCDVEFTNSEEQQKKKPIWNVRVWKH